MKKLTLIVIGAILLASCSSKEFTKSPVDDLIRDMSEQQNFTIILYDMDEDGWLSKSYRHQYKVITQDGEKPTSKTTEWQEVSENFFFQNENNMGMEVASKTDGKVSKQVAPPGYSNYVGNKQYGQWRTDNSGNSFWAFYGQYAFMSSMMGLVAGPVYRSSYYDYRNNYRGSRPYYGRSVNGRSSYGTYSSAAAKQNPRSSFQSKVASKTSKSSSSSTSRSGSRYGTSSSGSRSSSSRGGK